jgi:ribose 1,5-bisphosphokinase PhnN
MGIQSLGEHLTLNIGECPKEESVSTLSQILEETPHRKYYLSVKACLGILRRAEKRGKELPEILRQALIRQAQSSRQKRGITHAHNEDGDRR